LFRFPGGEKMIFFLQRVQTGSGALPAFCLVGTGGTSAGVKRPRLGGDHSLPFSADVKKEGAITPLPPFPLCIPNLNKNNFTFTFNFR